jgi:hypothetical protein
MKTSALTRTLAITFVLSLITARADAQRLALDDPPPGPPRVDISGSGGLLMSTDWSDLVLLGSVSPVAGALQQVLVRDLTVDPGPVYDGTITYWRGRYGFRAHTGFARSCVSVGRNCGDIPSLVDGTGAVHVKSYAYDVGAAIGLVEYDTARLAWPYAFFGLGGVTYDLDRTVGPPLTFIQRMPTTGAAAVVVERPESVLITFNELGLETRLALNVGIGTDFRIPLGPAGIGVRLELSDHMHQSPVDLQVTTLDAYDFGAQRMPNFGMVHNLRAAAGVVIHFGR